MRERAFPRILSHAPKDGGPFITLPVIHTKDPETGIRNVGMYRMQLLSERLTGMHWHKHKVSARHFEAYKKLKKRKRKNKEGGLTIAEDDISGWNERADTKPSDETAAVLKVEIIQSGPQLASSEQEVSL